MTVDTETSKLIATSIVDGVPINCNFAASSTSWIKVRYGDDVLATLTTHYTIALAGDYESFTVTPVAGFAALSDGTISISREPPFVQDFSLITREEVGSSSLENALDYMTFLAQYLLVIGESALRFPSIDADETRGLLPAASVRANKYLSFDADGVPQAVAVFTTDVLAVSSFGEDWVVLADAAAARVVLGFASGAPGAMGLQLLATADAAAVQSLLGYVSSADDITFSGDNDFTGENDFRTGTILVDTPALAAEAAPKSYVDSAITTAIAAIPTPTVIVKAPTTQILTAGTTYTTGTDGAGHRAKYIEIDFVGGGGGGGGAGAGASNGGTGGTTTFNSITAIGGTGGIGQMSGGGSGGLGGTGGAGSSGVIARTKGYAGHSGSADGTTWTFANGGNGGDGEFGSGGRGLPDAVAESASANTGGGGGGGATTDGTTVAAGGGGGGAGERVRMRISSPSASYSYALGAGGTAGTGDANGGAGGSGRVEVTEYYNW